MGGIALIPHASKHTYLHIRTHSRPTTSAGSCAATRSGARKKRKNNNSCRATYLPLAPHRAEPRPHFNKHPPTHPSTHNLIYIYIHQQEWAHALFPQLAFEDLLDRVQKLAGRARVRSQLDELREKERERFLVRVCMYVCLRACCLFLGCCCFLHVPPSCVCAYLLSPPPQASKFGSDYDERVQEYERAKRQEEARLDEERRRRREELYGTRKPSAGAAGAEGAASAEVVEDLGAVSTLCMYVCMCVCMYICMYVCGVPSFELTPFPSSRHEQEVDLEALERQRRERQERIAAELGASRIRHVSQSRLVSSRLVTSHH